MAKSSMNVSQRGCKKWFYYQKFYRLLLVIMCSVYSVLCYAQVDSNYVFSQSQQVYTPGISTSAIPAVVFDESWDDEITTYPFPFNFTYNGVAYTTAGTVGVDSDGWAAFNTGIITMTGTMGGGSWVSGSNSTGVYLNGNGNDNGFCGFNSDMEEQVFATFTGTLANGSPTITGISDFSNIRVGVRLSGTGITSGTVVNAVNAATQSVTMSGNATSAGMVTITPRASIYAFTRGIEPYRQFVIQWTRVTRYNAVSGDDFSFQLVLNEGGGNATYQTLQAVYGTLVSTNTAAQNAQVG